MMSGAITGFQAGQPLWVATVLGMVAFVFLFSAGMLWILQRSGIRLNAVVRGTFRKFGLNVVVSGNGFFGTYLTIVIATGSMIYLIARYVCVVK